jgi:uroporphyrin-III C-methyltransferase/precorrin-2 dehydrogenase/sirohydrochlorin ferrochelatase
MQQADVILYDRLVSDEVMELVRRDAELIYVGKERDNHSVPQDGISPAAKIFKAMGMKDVNCC